MGDTFFENSFIKAGKDSKVELIDRKYLSIDIIAYSNIDLETYLNDFSDGFPNTKVKPSIKRVERG